MQLHFNAVSEPGLPGEKWQKLYKAHSQAYEVWLTSKPNVLAADLKTSQAALKKYMPEMWPNYKRLCKLAKADDVAARFLTGFQPPPYLSACSSAVLSGKEIRLVRNYDYHPSLIEGTLLLSAWNGKKVIAMSDCLIGALDGMNEDGLAISLTFGGRKVVGKGFGIPFILRYVLEFCSNVQEAVDALTRIPSHMSYNVTVVDRNGSCKTVLLSPDRAAVITDAMFTTNHQIKVDWPENANFNKTIERSVFLNNLLAQNGLDAKTLSDAFLRKPLFNTHYSEGFGTLYTVVYCPEQGTMELRWSQDSILQSFDDFKEGNKLIEFEEPAIASIKDTDLENVPFEMTPQETVLPSSLKRDWQETVTETLTSAMAHSSNAEHSEKLPLLRDDIVQTGEISWEIVDDYWANTRKGLLE